MVKWIEAFVKKGFSFEDKYRILNLLSPATKEYKFVEEEMFRRLAVISDIHGNYKALEAFLEYCRKNDIGGIICLGDCVTDSPYPDRVMKLIRSMQKQYPCYMVRGNRENYLLENKHKDQGWRPSSATGCLYYTAKELTAEDLMFLGSLPEEQEIAPEGWPKLYICHGMPGDVRGNADLQPHLRQEGLKKIPGNYLLGGHSHHQEQYQWKGKTYLNPGSLGIAVDGVGCRAQFAVMELENVQTAEEVSITLHAIPYDIESFLADFSESGLDELGMVLNRAVKKTLLTGVNYFYEAVAEGQRRTGLAPGQIPESIWENIAEELEL